MAAFTMTLECGHEMQWQEEPGSGGGPVVGNAVYCAGCSVDQLIEECDPRQFSVETITLTDTEPQQSASPYGGYTVGTKATIFYDTNNGTYGYCFHGVGDSGLYSESDDVTGFASADEAKAAAIEDYTQPLPIYE